MAPYEKARTPSNGLKLLLTLLLLALVLKSVDISKIGQDLKTFSIKFLIPLVLLVGRASFCVRVVNPGRLPADAKEIPEFSSRCCFTGMFFNIGFSFLVGGDVVKAYILSRKTNKPLQIGFASVLQDRAAGFISRSLMARFVS